MLSRSGLLGFRDLALEWNLRIMLCVKESAVARETCEDDPCGLVDAGLDLSFWCQSVVWMAVGIRCTREVTERGWGSQHACRGEVR